MSVKRLKAVQFDDSKCIQCGLACSGSAALPCSHCLCAPCSLLTKTCPCSKQILPPQPAKLWQPQNRFLRLVTHEECNSESMDLTSFEQFSSSLPRYLGSFNLEYKHLILIGIGYKLFFVDMDQQLLEHSLPIEFDSPIVFTKTRESKILCVCKDNFYLVELENLCGRVLFKIKVGDTIIFSHFFSNLSVYTLDVAGKLSLYTLVDDSLYGRYNYKRVFQFQLEESVLIEPLFFEDVLVVFSTKKIYVFNVYRLNFFSQAYNTELLSCIYLCDYTVLALAAENRLFEFRIDTKGHAIQQKGHTVKDKKRKIERLIQLSNKEFGVLTKAGIFLFEFIRHEDWNLSFSFRADSRATARITLLPLAFFGCNTTKNIEASTDNQKTLLFTFSSESFKIFSRDETPLTLSSSSFDSHNFSVLKLRVLERSPILLSAKKILSYDLNNGFLSP